MVLLILRRNMQDKKHTLQMLKMLFRNYTFGENNCKTRLESQIGIFSCVYTVPSGFSFVINVFVFYKYYKKF